MTRRAPFLFCRYAFEIDNEILDANAQYTCLSELQGQYYAHGPTAERERRFDSVVMRPRRFEIEGNIVISWSVGQKIIHRLTAEYDEATDRLEFVSHEDSSVRYSDFVAVPGLGALAVDDRISERHLGGKAAIRRFQSIFRNLDYGEAVIHQVTSSEEVDRALDQWELTEFSFVVRPYNPHPPSDLSRKLSEQLAADGIGRYTAKAKPVGGKMMKPADDGHIAAAREMADAGYGQFSVSGITPEHHEAKIKRPRFHEEVRQNQKIQSEPRELRVYIRSEDDADETIFHLVGEALIGFYGS